MCRFHFPLFATFYLCLPLASAQFYNWEPSEKGCPSFSITSTGADGDYGICNEKYCCSHEDGSYCFQGTLFNMPFSGVLTCSLTCEGTSGTSDGSTTPGIAATMYWFNENRDSVGDDVVLNCGNSVSWTRRSDPTIQHDLNLFVNTYTSSPPPYSFSATLTCQCDPCTDCGGGCYDCHNRGCSVACPPTAAPSVAPVGSSTTPAPTASPTCSSFQQYVVDFSRWAATFFWPVSVMQIKQLCGH